MKANISEMSVSEVADLKPVKGKELVIVCYGNASFLEYRPVGLAVVGSPTPSSSELSVKDLWGEDAENDSQTDDEILSANELDKKDYEKEKGD